MENLTELGAEQIVARAHKWTFEGDVVLLEFMKKISHDLAQHASSTSDQLQQLTAKLNGTSTALDNAANSLTALQYTKFVESRCHDDDETVANGSVPLLTDVGKADTDTCDVLKMFLTKNLEMLNKCHEKVVLAFDDSDEEESINNYIYKPKNPHNERLLPHIFGSKLWKEQWHVGIGGDKAEYSADEASETFSESTSSTEDNESYESNSADLSEWDSSISIPIDKSRTKIKVENVSSLEGSQALFPTATDKITRAPPKQQIASDSDTSTKAARPKAIIERKNEHDFFETPQNIQPTAKERSSGSSSGSVSSRNMAQIERQPSLKKYNPPESTPDHPQSSRVVSAQPVQKQIHRKPINLFDDDDFNSLMSEISDKIKHKSNTVTETLETKADNVKVVESESSKFLDHFASPVAKEGDKLPSSRPVEVIQKVCTDDQKVKKTPLNLFESPTGSPTNPSVFSAPTAVQDSNTNTNNGKTQVTAKTLFDDDYEDDDFLNVFRSAKVPVPTPNNKSKLFSSDEPLIDSKPNEGNHSAQRDPTADKKLTEFDKNSKHSSKASSDTFEDFNHPDVAGEILEKRPSYQDTPRNLQKVNYFDDEDDLFDKPTTDWKNATTPHQSATEKEPKINIYEKTIESTPQAIRESTSAFASNDDFTKSIAEITNAVCDNIATIAKNTENENTVIEKIEDQKEAKPDTKDGITKPPTALSYGSIFLDEPPDDDDFFKALDNNQFSSSKLALDSEHRFLGSEANKAEEPLKEQSKPDAITIGDYGSLRLFSDVPPDDDGVSIDFHGSDEINAVETKQLHSVFYDDFSETMEAVKTSNENKISNLSIFDSEPPPDDDQFDIVAEIHTNIAPPGDNILPLVPNAIQGNKDNDEIDFRIASASKEVMSDHKSSRDKTSKSISKLKMPLININVQALVPGVSTKLSCCNTSELKAEDAAVEQTVTTFEKEKSSQKLAQQSNNNVNILTSVCKDRVRPPTNRRPSTRRARQESYQKSLPAEQGDDHEITPNIIDGKENSEIENAQRNPLTGFKCFSDDGSDDDIGNETIQQKVVEKENATICKLSEHVKLSDEGKGAKAAITTSAANMFMDSESDADDYLFGRKVEGPFDEGTCVVEALSAIRNAQQSRFLFDDEQSDSAEDLFQSDQSRKTGTTADSFSPVDGITQKSSHKNILSKLDAIFGSDDDCDDDVDFLASLKGTKNTKSPAKESAISKNVNTKSVLFSDIESDDENDLFGGGKDTQGEEASRPRTSKQPSQQLKSTRTTQHSAQSVSTMSTQNDNPLADLLNS